MRRFTLIESYEASIAALECKAREADRAAAEIWDAVILLRRYLEEAKQREPEVKNSIDARLDRLRARSTVPV